MADISTIESAWLRANTQFERWRVEFEKNFGAPVTNTITGMAANRIQNLPPDVQNASRQLSPVGWNILDKVKRRK